MYKDYFPQPKISAEPKDPLGKRIRKFYARQFQSVKLMRRHILISALIFLVVIIAGFVFFYRYYDFSKPLPSAFQRIFTENDFRAGSVSTFMNILLNNLRVSFLLCLAGLIPFFLASAVFLIMNGSLLGLVLAMMAKMNLPVIKLFTTQILPHGLIELSQLVFTAGFSLYLSSQMTKRFLRKKEPLSADFFGSVEREALPDRMEALGDIFSLVGSVILPLIIIAAFIETFITPYVYGWIF